MSDNLPQESFKQRMWRIVFEAETRAGKVFDVILIWLIIASVIVVMLETVDYYSTAYAQTLYVLEWCFTALFTIEYFLRLWLTRKPLKYAFSFFGIVDFLSCIPTYLLLLPFGGAAAHSLRVIRILRLFRIFRVLKMVHHVRGANVILRGLQRSKAKITVFFVAMGILSVIAGTLMYLVESRQPDSQFTSIPVSVYYAVVSITTVGYGDITAATSLGKFLTSLMILTGYAIIAVPTGIVSSEMLRADVDETSDACSSCGVHGHLHDAKFCRKCGEKLKEEVDDKRPSKNNG